MALAVPGISCIRPRAPAGLMAPTSNPLSWRMTANSNAGSVLPPAGKAMIG